MDHEYDDNDAGLQNNLEVNPDLEEELTTEELKQKIKDLKSELLAVKDKADSNWDLLLRARAEEENLRKRFRLDLEHAHKYGIEKFAKSMLGVIDSLELGMASVSKLSEEDLNHSFIKSLCDGMELTLKLVLSSLEDFGIKMLDPIGEKFNPMHHEAISIQSQEGVSSNNIVTVVQKGFMIHDRILRPAKVIVAK